jgi:hypothetical protein
MSGLTEVQLLRGYGVTDEQLAAALAVDTCEASGCLRGPAPQQVFCSRHWCELPLELRSRIWRLFRTQPDSDAHLAAIGEAAQLLEAMP